MRILRAAISALLITAMAVIVMAAAMLTLLRARPLYSALARIRARLVLLVYGAQAMRRFLQPAPQGEDGMPTASAEEIPRRKAIGLALALSWLNPHAWLDTAVVIGTASLAYAQPDNAVFGLGAITGSLLWFTGLGVALWCVGRRLNSPVVWRAMDLLVALMMWGTAFWLVRGLL